MRCPICNAEVALTPETKTCRPFCSTRCKSIDLGKWLSESYRIPLDDSESEPEPSPIPKPIGEA